MDDNTSITVEPVPIDDLTTVEIDGTGVFDKLLSLQRIHLDREFKLGRIQGKEYSDVFLKSYVASLNEATQFLLSKEKQKYENALLDVQKNKVEKEIELAEAQLEEQKHKNSVLLPLIEEKTKAELCNLEEDCKTKQFTNEFILPEELNQKVVGTTKLISENELVLNQAEVSKNQAALTAAEANNAIKQGNILEEQKCQIKAETTRIIYDTEHKLPEEINAIKKQNLLTQAQMDDVRKGVDIKEFQLSSLMPKELENLDAQITRLVAESANTVKQGELLNAQVCQSEVEVARLRYETEHKLPQEVENLRRQSMLISAQAGTQEEQTKLTEEQVSNLIWERTTKFPEEILLLKAETMIKEKQASISEKQLAIIEKELTDKMPAEIAFLNAQVDKMLADVEATNKQIEIATIELLLKEREIELAELQKELNQWKVATEQAQTMDSAQPGSAIDWGNKVMEAQTDGFYNDANQKATDTLLRTWVTRMNNDRAWVNNANMLTDKYIGRAIAKMFEGLDIDVTLRDEDDEIFTPPDI